MAMLLKGAPVAAALNGETAARSVALKSRGIAPTLAILRVGAREDDLAYERGAMKRCAEVGIEVRREMLNADVTSEEFFRTLEALNGDEAVHGILMLRPLPGHLDGERARKLLNPAKDVDGCTDGSLAGVFTNTALGFAPCTAQAAMEVLDYYSLPCQGKRAVVIGRSLVVGRPAAMLLLHKNATVTICHTKTPGTAAIAREADILLVCSGQTESVGQAYTRPGQVVIDVGIGWSEAKQKLCGDVRFEEVEPVCSAITPVPGGVGSVTTAVLCRHVVEAAERSVGK